MTRSFSSREVPNKRTAISLHKQMRAEGASIVQLGELYISMIDRRLWSSQAAMAADFGLSPSNVSRSITAARLPRAVVNAVGGDVKLTFSLAERLDFFVTQLGASVVSDRASKIPDGLSIPEIEHALLTGAPPRPDEVTVSLSADRHHLIVESPRLPTILREAPNIVQLINSMLRAR
ncbi:hypothetical protein [Burkholderia pseudomallei]|uniref:hypothetical protein n=1 Tax=Burkholderia pseudomallei TaxID=28450 RepID=UPI00194025A5|nr:hypothetical protein [Burkholderia pseudomallei]MBM5584919.1 hypothetical protein [Burkholderia pseudomallei]